MITNSKLNVKIKLKWIFLVTAREISTNNNRVKPKHKRKKEIKLLLIDGMAKIKCILLRNYLQILKLIL